MTVRHTKRPGFWLGFIGFFTGRLFFLLGWTEVREA